MTNKEILTYLKNRRDYYQTLGREGERPYINFIIKKELDTVIKHIENVGENGVIKNEI